MDKYSLSSRRALFHLIAAVIALLLTVLIVWASSGLPAGKAVRLFDGKTFKGWEGDQKVFRIEDGAIVGGSLNAPLARNEFLCTTRDFTDFVLRLKFKVLGKGANAGVQFRSRRIPNNNEVIGYQADLGDKYWGALYDESRRKVILARPDDALIDRILKRDDWNDYEIRAEGRRVRLGINGHETVDYTEKEDGLTETGCICLQIHGGPPSEARYKEIIIEELPNK
ncbi:MAG TPA: DUF1080 domain-containing protein [Blastocatellia bacterium]|nr:DUF1080 domain-containing protein [Blastocatellia bacterium]